MAACELPAKTMTKPMEAAACRGHTHKRGIEEGFSSIRLQMIIDEDDDDDDGETTRTTDGALSKIADHTTMRQVGYDKIRHQGQERMKTKKKREGKGCIMLRYVIL